MIIYYMTVISLKRSTGLLHEIPSKKVLRQVLICTVKSTLQKNVITKNFGNYKRVFLKRSSCIKDYLFSIKKREDKNDERFSVTRFHPDFVVVRMGPD